MPKFWAIQLWGCLWSSLAVQRIFKNIRFKRNLVHSSFKLLVGMHLQQYSSIFGFLTVLIIMSILQTVGIHLQAQLFGVRVVWARNCSAKLLWSWLPTGQQ